MLARAFMLMWHILCVYANVAHIMSVHVNAHDNRYLYLACMRMSQGTCTHVHGRVIPSYTMKNCLYFIYAHKHAKCIYTHTHTT